MGGGQVIWSFLKAHWRPFAVLAALLAVFAIGRYSAPKPTIHESVHETVRTVQVEDKQSKEMVRVLTAQLTELKRNVHRVTHVVTKADGSSETTTTVDSTEKQSTDTRAQVAVDTQSHVQSKTTPRAISPP
jgi:hypothetical protein